MYKALRRKYESKIRARLSGSFELRLFAAALDNLEVRGPLSFNNFAYSIRETIRQMLHRMAPTEEIQKCAWFKPTKDVSNGITRRDRARYAIHGGLSIKFVTRKLGIDTEPALDELLHVIDTLSKFTHIEPATFGISRTKTLQLAAECLEAMAYFVEHIEDCRLSVLHAVGEAIDQHLMDRVLWHTVDDVDLLSTHSSVEALSIESMMVKELGSQSMSVEVEGSADVRLQYGSDSDVDNDIGAVMNDSFPFNAIVMIEFERPLGKVAAVTSFSIDTSSWYE